MRLIPRWVVPLSCIAFLAGCYQDRTSAPGEMGRIVYSLSTSYDVPQGDLRQARIITGHAQTVWLELTDRGARDIPEPALLQHRLTPSGGTTVRTHADEDAPSSVSVDVAVDQPGTYALESILGDRVMDRIDLQFEQPDGFEVIVKVRGPWGESFDRLGGNPIAVEEGSQVVLQAVPVDASRGRLAGDMTPLLDVSPEWAVTPGQGVVFNSEYSMWTFRAGIDFYFIEPGLVTFTVFDPVSDASTDQQFDVTPVVH